MYRTANEDERAFAFSSEENDKRGCIAHVRTTMDNYGDCYHRFEEHSHMLVSPQFTKAMDEICFRLSSDEFGCALEDRKHMTNWLWKQGKDKEGWDDDNNYYLRFDTERFVFFARFTARPGYYPMYLYGYDKTVFERSFAGEKI